MTIPQERIAATWRAVRYVYAAPLALLLVCAMSEFLTYYQCSFLMVMFILMLLPAAVVIEQAGLRKGAR